MTTIFYQTLGLALMIGIFGRLVLALAWAAIQTILPREMRKS